MIEVSGLRKVYRGKVEVVAVEDVSFRARQGEIFGLLGPNGAGKTTTLRIVSTVLRATAGSVVVQGTSVADDAQEVRRQIGFLSAGTALYDRLNPREMLAYFGRLNGMTEDRLQARIDELIETFDMGEFQDRHCGLLSTGQKQKVSIARALVHDPPVLVFDEPTAGLDVMVARTLLEQIEALRDSRRTIILSTHIMREAERLCDRLAIIHKGRIQAQGTLADIREHTGEADLEEAFFSLVERSEQAEAPSV